MNVWIIEWDYKYHESMVVTSAQEAYNKIFDRIAEYVNFKDLREQLGKSFDEDTTCFGIPDVVWATKLPNIERIKNCSNMWVIEDYDCSHVVTDSKEKAFKYMYDSLMKSDNSEENKMEGLKELLNSYNRTDGYTTLCIDEFMWAYEVDYI